MPAGLRTSRPSVGCRSRTPAARRPGRLGDLPASPYFTDSELMGDLDGLQESTLNELPPLIWQIGRMVTPAVSSGSRKAVMPRCLTASGSVRASSSPRSAWRAPTTRPFARAQSSCRRAGRPAGQSGEVRARARFAEELAGQLIGAQERSKEPIPLSVGAEQRHRRSHQPGGHADELSEGGTASPSRSD